MSRIDNSHLTHSINGNTSNGDNNKQNAENELRRGYNSTFNNPMTVKDDFSTLGMQ